MSLRNFSYLVLSAILFTCHSYAQTYQRQINFPNISNGSNQYQNPMSGGFNNIEHQFVDIDNDGDLDLFFLNSDGTFGLLLNTGTPPQPVLTLNDIMIEGLDFLDWFYFIDADADNDYDYFTSNGEYITYKKNSGTIFSPTFQTGIDTLKDDQGGNIQNETGSNPVLADIDADNDYDLFLGNTAGTVTYYENIGTPQIFSYKFITNSWQNIVIIGTLLKDDPLHGASSLEFTDIDSDNDLDLIWGDFFSNSLYLLNNFGNSVNPNVQLTSNIYPLNEDSVNTSGFNMPRLSDIDNDGDLDLFVSVLYDPTVPQSLMYYENQGSNTIANHEKITEDYLMTLDVGNNSHPVFVDIDADGDDDLFIGSLKNPLGSIYYFENLGTSTVPDYKLITENFSGISGDLSVTPSFGDIDGDGDYDLLVGRFDGKISFYRNIGTAFNPNFSNEGLLLDILSNPIDVGTSSVPLLLDNDGDGDLDLTIGSFNGRLSYYQNIGSALIHSFNFDPNYYTGIDVGDNSAPFLIDYDYDGDFDLFCGNRAGSIVYFNNDANNLLPVWNSHNNFITEFNFGGYSAPYFIDIENDTDIDLMFGNIKGGLYFYSNLTISDISDWKYKQIEFELLEAYPNPFNPNTKISFTNSEAGLITLKVYNTLGESVQELFSGFKQAGKHQINFDASDLSAGIYFVVMQTNKSLKTLKIVLLK